MGTTTSNYSFYKPASGEQGWASLVNANFDDIDSLLFAGDHGDLTGQTGLFALSRHGRDLAGVLARELEPDRVADEHGGLDHRRRGA